MSFARRNVANLYNIAGMNDPNSPSAVQRIDKSTGPLADKRLASLARLLAHVSARPAATAGLQVGVAARLRAGPGVHASDLAGAVDLIGRALELVADELGAAGDGAGAAVELLAGDGGAEEAFLGAGVGEGRVPGVSGVVCGGERALGGSRVGEGGGGGREDGAEDEGCVHCVGELDVGADGVEEVGELAFGVGEEGRDGVLEGVVGSVNRVGGRGRLVVGSLLGLKVKVDRGRHLPRVPDAGQRLYVYDTAAFSLCSPVRACVPVSPSEQGKCGHILSPAILSHPHHGGPATHRSRAPTRCSGAREASCIVVKPSHLVESTKETRYRGHRCVRASETWRFHATPCPMRMQSWLYAMSPIGGLALRAR